MPDVEGLPGGDSSCISDDEDKILISSDSSISSNSGDPDCMPDGDTDFLPNDFYKISISSYVISASYLSIQVVGQLGTDQLCDFTYSYSTG